ncbi:MAG TPA: LysR family transcriptional regulator [Roseiarcus sp.]|jgi:LysR family transcriptional regulator, hydrogen peroxide-inducible genes activator|nr:LysR family transcriptional regulator [Roseiarcus sp.]
MEMHQVRYFLALADQLNFTRASELCNVTQPSLSRAIKLLEEELGGPLFRRERETTHLTDLGALVRPHLQSVHDHTKQAKRLSKEFARKWPLKLGIMSTISPDEIVDLIANIRTRHPEVELRLCDANAKDLRARLLAGELEVAIYALPGDEADEHIHSIPLFREQMVLAVHRGHRLAKTGAFPVKEMNGESYIHRMNCEFAGYADQILEQKGVTCKPVYWSERDDWTLAMVAAGLGFAFMPVNLVKHPGVVGLPVVEPEFWRQVSLVSVRGRRHSPGVGSLVREAMRKKWFGKQPERAMDSEDSLEEQASFAAE